MPVRRATDVDKGRKVVACIIAHIFINCLFGSLDEEITNTRVNGSHIFEASYEGTYILESGTSNNLRYRVLQESIIKILEILTCFFNW